MTNHAESKIAFHYIQGTLQLSDSLTKCGASDALLLQVLQSGKLPANFELREIRLIDFELREICLIVCIAKKMNLIHVLDRL